MREKGNETAKSSIFVFIRTSNHKGTDTMELIYTKVGDYYIPDPTAEPLPSRDLDKYGRSRLHYLQDYKSELYAAL